MRHTRLLVRPEGRIPDQKAARNLCRSVEELREIGRLPTIEHVYVVNRVGLGCDGLGLLVEIEGAWADDFYEPRQLAKLLFSFFRLKF